jgi:hypothetical protein
MPLRHVLRALVFVWLLCGMAAEAVIKLEFPVSRIYRDAKTVRSGTVVAVDVGKRLVEVKPGACSRCRIPLPGSPEGGTEPAASAS